jgi:hypothetical protein
MHVLRIWKPRVYNARRPKIDFQDARLVIISLLPSVMIYERNGSPLVLE